jgi:hypothetical protein
VRVPPQSSECCFSDALNISCRKRDIQVSQVGAMIKEGHDAGAACRAQLKPFQALSFVLLLFCTSCSLFAYIATRLSSLRESSDSIHRSSEPVVPSSFFFNTANIETVTFFAVPYMFRPDTTFASSANPWLSTFTATFAAVNPSGYPSCQVRNPVRSCYRDNDTHTLPFLSPCPPEII